MFARHLRRLDDREKRSMNSKKIIASISSGVVLSYLAELCAVASYRVSCLVFLPHTSFLLWGALDLRVTKL